MPVRRVWREADVGVLPVEVLVDPVLALLEEPVAKGAFLPCLVTSDTWHSSPSLRASAQVVVVIATIELGVKHRVLDAITNDLLRVAPVLPS